MSDRIEFTRNGEKRTVCLTQQDPDGRWTHPVIATEGDLRAAGWAPASELAYVEQQRELAEAEWQRIEGETADQLRVTTAKLTDAESRCENLALAASAAESELSASCLRESDLRLRIEGLQADLGEVTAESLPARCPSCDSPDPKRHPAMQFEGEVQVCPDAWHTPQPQAPLPRSVEETGRYVVSGYHWVADEAKDPRTAGEEKPDRCPACRSWDPLERFELTAGDWCQDSWHAARAPAAGEEKNPTPAAPAESGNRCGHHALDGKGGYCHNCGETVPPDAPVETGAVCQRCGDTHVVEVTDDVGDSKRQMCTACPVPCSDCRAGAYCKTTPCGCSCHVSKKAPAESGGEKLEPTWDRALRELTEKGHDVPALLEAAARNIEAFTAGKPPADAPITRGELRRVIEAGRDAAGPSWDEGKAAVEGFKAMLGALG